MRTKKRARSQLSSFYRIEHSGKIVMRFVTWGFLVVYWSIPDFGHEELIEYEVAFDSASTSRSVV